MSSDHFELAPQIVYYHDLFSYAHNGLLLKLLPKHNKQQVFGNFHYATTVHRSNILNTMKLHIRRTKFVIAMLFVMPDAVQFSSERNHERNSSMFSLSSATHPEKVKGFMISTIHPVAAK